ncbi:MAG: MFS transporter [Ginsengibacter sp.]
MYNSGLFASWVPRPLQLVLLLIFLIPSFSISGIYMPNAHYMFSGTGSMAEHMYMANYATNIGMSVAFPLMLRILQRFRKKQILITALFICSVLSFICGTTSDPGVIILCSLLIGFFKMFAAVISVLPIFGFISKAGNKAKIYSVFYPLVFTIAILVNWCLFKAAYLYNWQYPFMLMVGALMGLILLALIFVHNQRSFKKLPLYGIDWLSIPIYVSSWLCFAYIASFGKQQGWLQSESVKLALAGFFVLMGIFIIRVQMVKRPFINLRILRDPSVRYSILFLMAIGAFMGVSSIQTTYTSILQYGSYHSTLLSFMTLPGIILAGFVGFNYFGKGLSVRMYIFTGFLAYTLNAFIMYFMISPEVNYSMWWLPMILNGYAMAALMAAVWFYAINHLQIHVFLNAFGMLFLVRTFLGTAFASLIVSWLTSHFQWESVNNIAMNMDIQNMHAPMAAIYGKVQMNAMLVSFKTFYGYLGMFGIIFLFITLLHHFGKINYRSVILYYKLIGARPKKKVIVN